MARLLSLAGISCLLVFAGGCAGFYQAPVVPAYATAFTNIEAPVSTEFGESTPVALKSGESSAVNFLGLFAIGDASLDAAAAQGALKKMYYADYSYLNVLGIYSKFTTIVHGE